MSRQRRDSAMPAQTAGTAAAVTDVRRQAALLKTGALQNAILNSANFSSIATDEKGVIHLFNVGAERMLGYTALEVVDKLTPADISDPQEVVARAQALSLELATPIQPGFEALVFKASRGIEDIYELTYARKDGSRFPAVVSVTALRDAQVRPRFLTEFSIDALMTTAPRGIITDVNQQMEALIGYSRDELIGASFRNYFTDPNRAEAGIERRSEEHTS